MGSLKDQLLAKGLAAKPTATATAAPAVDPAVARRQAEEEATAAAHAAASPRYPGARIATLAAARALFEPRAYELRNLSGDVDGSVDLETLLLPSVQVIDGDATLDELRAQPGGSNLYVMGDLTITGRLVQPRGSNAIVVFGALRAHHVVTSAALLVFGDLDVTGVLYGNASDATNVLGTARVATLVSCKGHAFSLWGPRTIGELVRRQAPAPNFDVYAAAPKIRTGRVLDPAIGDLNDDTVIAAALLARDDIFVAP